MKPKTRPFNRLRFILDRGLTVANLPDRAAAAHDDSPAFHLDEPLPYDDALGRAVTPRAFVGFCNRLGRALTDGCGMRRHDRVAVMKANHADYYLLDQATIRAGGIAVPVNGAMAPDIAGAYLAATGVSVLITDSVRLRRLVEADALPAGLRHVLITDAQSAAAAPKCVPRARSLGELMRQVEDAPLEPADLAADDHALICHTSGTTGIPKGVLLTSGALVAGLKGQLKIEPVFRGDRALMAAPFNHFINHSGLMSALAARVPCWLEGGEDPGRLLDLIEHHRLSVVFGFPHVFRAMLEHGLDDYDLRSVRLWIAGADSSHEAHIRPFLKHGAALRLFGRRILSSAYVDTFGSSEVGFAALFNPAFSFTRRYGRCVGRPSFAGPRVKVADALGRRLRTGRVGRLMVKGPSLFHGYWNAHDKHHGAFRDGWWWTGDMVYRDRAGRYYHMDREADVIETDRGPVYSLPLEEALLRHPSVSEAVVFGDGAPGRQRVVALVQARPGRAIAADDVMEWMDARLPEGSRIEAVRVVDAEAIPCGFAGKVLKRVLRERLIEADRMDAHCPPGHGPGGGKQNDNIDQGTVDGGSHRPAAAVQRGA